MREGGVLEKGEQGEEGEREGLGRRGGAEPCVGYAAPPMPSSVPARHEDKGKKFVLYIDHASWLPRQLLAYPCYQANPVSPGFNLQCNFMTWVQCQSTLLAMSSLAGCTVAKSNFNYCTRQWI